MKPRVLLFDIETSPNLAYVWGKYQQDVIAYEKEWELLCFAWKWLGQKRIYVKSRRKHTEEELVDMLHALFDEAHVLIAHNGDRFDIKKTNAKFVEYQKDPPSPYKTIDTRKQSYKHFMFNSNKLNDLAKLFNIGTKVETGGFQLWLDCMAGKTAGWKKMEMYNKQDIVLLEEVYLRIRHWMTTHPNMNLYQGSRIHCRVCGGLNLAPIDGAYHYMMVQKRQMYFCDDCRSWSKGEIIKEGKTPLLR